VNSTDILLWIVFPYLALAVLAGGTIWRYRYDKFGWTTRSSQLHETAVLRWGSPLFHFGVLMVLVGHVMGLLVPKSWTEAVGITEHLYHLMAVFIGTVAGLCTLIGLAILILRRRLTGPVFAATTRNDKAMYVVLTGVIVLGLLATVKANLSPFKAPRHVVPVPEVTRGPNGKADYAWAKKIAGEHVA
jgi:nitrate reductase gamma subunit